MRLEERIAELTEAVKDNTGAHNKRKRRSRPIDFSVAFGRSRESEVCW